MENRKRVRTFEPKKQVTMIPKHAAQNDSQLPDGEEQKIVSKDADSIKKDQPMLQMLTLDEEKNEQELFEQLKKKCSEGEFEPGNCVQICQKIQQFLQPSKLSYGIIVYQGINDEVFWNCIYKKSTKRHFIVEKLAKYYIVFQTFPEAQGEVKGINNEQVMNIAKNFQKNLSFEPKNGYTAKHYAQAVNEAFQKKKITPRLIICKKQPSGDEYWDYFCPQIAKVHTWDLIKDRAAAIAVLI